MLQIFLEFAFSICVCGALAYFYFLSDPILEHDVGQEAASGSRHSMNSAVYGSRSTPAPERSRKCEGGVWCNVLGRWVALLVLGGGSIDKDVWTDRIAFFLFKVMVAINESCKQKCLKKKRRDCGSDTSQLQEMCIDIVKLLRVELGGGGPLSMSGVAAQSTQQQQQQHHCNQSAKSGLYNVGPTSDSVPHRTGGSFVESPMHYVGQESSVPTAPPIGVVLPRVGGISSFESTHASSETACKKTEEVLRTLRSFTFPITYEDQRFAVHLDCKLPIFAFIPSGLQIPADLWTLHAVLSIKSIAFHSVVHAAFCGNVVELSFAREPQFTASFEISNPRSCHGVQQTGNSSGGGAGDHAKSHPSMFAGGGRQQEKMDASGIDMPSTSQRTKEKLKEMVNLAVRKALKDITYPCVMQGRVGKSHQGKGLGGDTRWDAGLVSWSLEKATLPLRG